MKKQLSVFALHARAAIGRLALVLLGTLALDAAAYALFGLRMYPPSLTGSALVTALRVVFSLGLLVCQLLLAACFGTGSRYGYTLRRLQIPETRVLLWSGVCNALCFACVWCVQLMASVGTAALHAADARYAEGAQGIFVDFYRSEFLHGLLPLADGYLWVRNVVFVLALGVLTAYMQLGLRRKNGGPPTDTGRSDRPAASCAAGPVRIGPDRRASAERGCPVRRGPVRLSWVPAGAQRKGGARG